MDEFPVKSMDPFQSWLPLVIAAVVGILMMVRAVMGGQLCPSTNMINEQIVIITGASGGIGFEVTNALCQRNAKIIMACKDMEKANKAISKIKKFNSTASIEVQYLDLRSFDCIRRFSKIMHKNVSQIDILINNAGIIFNVKDKTVDGFETHLQVNYLGHFLLTKELLPLLRKSNQGRIINISAHAYSSGRMDIDDPLNIGTYATNFHQREAFSHSKLAVVLASRHLAKVLKGSSVTVNCCTPGLVRGTEHLRRSPIMNSFCAKTMTYPWMWIFMKNAQQGAQTIIYLATEPKLKNISGEYFNDCEKYDLNELAMDDKLAESLFTRTMKALRLESF